MAKKRTKRKAAALKMSKSRTVKAKALAKPANGADPLRAVEQFLYRQAECLDGKDWQGFIDLFAKDGMYWMPAEPEQTTGDGVPSIFYEDRDLMNVRARRMEHPRAWSQKTAWGTNHLVSNVRIEKQDAKTGAVTVRSRFLMMEFRNDVVRHFAGSYLHHLEKAKDGYRIKLQRVDMVNGQGTYDYVLQAWV
jgi:3-phenylpropionate/cinnamic acid dioxygenase small subunit